jgi:hypothetical protein
MNYRFVAIALFVVALAFVFTDNKGVVATFIALGVVFTLMDGRQKSESD